MSQLLISIKIETSRTIKVIVPIITSIYVSIEIQKDIREQFYKAGVLFKINASFPIPQVIINNSLVLSYNEFISLNESDLLMKIVKGEICHHIRFYNSEIIHPLQDNGRCIYCYSEKKKNSTVTAIIDQRNYFSEENHEMLSFCEKNDMTILLYDIENPFLNSNSENKMVNDFLRRMTKAVIIDNEAESLENFFYLLDKKCSLSPTTNNKCSECGSIIECSVKLKKCFDCLMGRKRSMSSSISSSLEYSNNNNTVQQYSKKNPYNFIEKLKLKKLSHDEENIYNEEENDDINNECTFSYSNNSFEPFRTFHSSTEKMNEKKLEMGFTDISFS